MEYLKEFTCESCGLIGDLQSGLCRRCLSLMRDEIMADGDDPQLPGLLILSLTIFSVFALVGGVIAAAMWLLSHLRN